MNYKTEFPDYPETDMPALPDGYVDISWHNDVCPAIENGIWRIWIDYSDIALRETQVDTLRFNVVRCDDETVATAFQSDHWPDVLEFLARPQNKTATRYVVRDKATQGSDFLLWGDNDRAAAHASLASALADGLDVELVTMPADAMDPHTRTLIKG